MGKAKIFAIVMSVLCGIIAAGIAVFIFLVPKPEQYKVEFYGDPSIVAYLYGDGAYEKGDEVTLIAQEKPGFSFESWLKEDVVVSYESTYTFTMSEKTRGRYTATYLPKDFSITAIKENGNFNITQDAKVGESVQITDVEAAPGYQQAEMYYVVEGKGDKVEIKNNSFVMPVGNISVYVEFTPITYTIEYIYEEDVVITGLVEEYNVETNTFTLPIPARTGYVFDGWTGTDQTEPKVALMIEKGSIGNRQYTANWQKQLYTITIADSVGGAIDVIEEAYYQDQLTITVSCETGYLLTALYYMLPGDEDQYDIDLTFDMPAGNITVYAIFEQVLYTVSKDPNVENGIISLSRLGANLGDQVVVSVATDEGYELVRTWYILEGTTTEVDFTHNFNMPAGNVTVYADVQPICYTITYKLDGGTLPQDAKTSYYVWDSFDLPIPTKVGHVFDNWTITIGGDASSISRIEEGSTGNIELTAVWHKETYLIEFVTEDGSRLYADYFEFETTPTYGNSTPTKASTNTHHYIFSGWSPELYPANKAQVYTAQFEAVERVYVVQFNANGGSTVDPEEYKYGEVLSNLSSKVTTRQGYNFIGWFTALTGGFEVSSQTQVLQDVTYYARWSAVTYAITLDLDGGQVGGNNPISYTIQDNDFTLPTPTKEGHDFLGWQLQGSANIEETVTIQKGSYGDKTYIAKWQAKTFTIVWKNYDGTILETDTVEYNTMPTYDGETPVRENDVEYSYIFTGWDPEVSSATADAEYTATFNGQNLEFTIKFDSMGGSVVSDETRHYGDKILTLPITTRDGYTLYGWFTQPVGGTQVTEEYRVTQNTTLYARWDTITYSLTYNLDGGSISGQAISYNIETPTFTLPTPTKEAYDFAGWTGTDLLQATMTVTISKGSIGHRIYTATWTKTVYDIAVASLVNGSVDVVTTATKGDSVLVTISPDAGYKVDEQYYLISGDETQYEFTSTITMPANNIKIYVTFVKELYTIAIDEYMQNGVVVALKENAYYGDEITIETSPDDRYRLGSVWYQDAQGANKTTITDNKFTMPAFDVYICAEFVGPYYMLSVVEDDTYDIDIFVKDQSGKTLATSGDVVQIKSGDQITITVVVYQEGLEDIAFVGEIIGSDTVWNSAGVYNMPEGDVYLTPIYTLITYSIQAQPCDNGSLTIESSSKFNTEVNVTATPATGYNLSELYYIRESDGQRVDIDGTSFIMPASDIRVYAEFSNRSYTITKIAPENGDFAISKTSANYNEEITLTITPASGYSYFEAYYQTSSDVVPINDSKFLMPAEDVSITVVFTKTKYTITIPEFDEFNIYVQEKLDGAGDPWYVGENSYISLEWGQEGVVTLNDDFASQYNADLSYIYYYNPVTPTTEMKIVNNLFVMPQHNVVIGAHLVPNNYSIVVSGETIAGDVYLVDEEGNEIASWNEVIEIPYKTQIKWIWKNPTLGYDIEVRDDGVYIERGVYFEMPARNVTLSVYAYKHSYNISSGRYEHGNIEVASSRYYGESVDLTISPDAGYELTELYYIKVGDSSNTKYDIVDNTFVMPASDVTVYAVFEQISDFTVGDYSYHNIGNSTAQVISFNNSTATTTTVPDSVEYKGTNFTVVELVDGVFDGKTKLATVNIGKNITTISYAQFNGSGVTTVNIADDNPNYTDLDINAIFTKDTLVLISACNGTIASGSKSYSGVGSYAFRGVYNGEVVLPSGLTYISDYAFDNSNLTSITLPESLTSIGSYAFNSADNIGTMILPGNVNLEEYALSGWNGTLCIKNSAIYNAALINDEITKSNFDHLTGVYVLRSIDKGTSTYFNDKTKYPYVYPKVTFGDGIYNLYSTVEQEVVNFYLTVNDGSLGEASYEGGYHLGNTVTISAHAYGNNFFLGWKVNPEDENYVSTDAEYSFTVTNNGATSYCAIFAPGYNLNFIYMSEGITSVEVTTEQGFYIETSNFGISVQAKTNVSIVVSVADGYTISMIDMEFSGSSYDQFYTSNAEFIMPEIDLNIYIYADKEVYVYSTNVTGLGEVEISSNNSEGSAYYDSDIVVTATPATGYKLSKMYYVCANDSQQTQYEFVDSFTMPANNVTIYVVFEAVFTVFSNDVTLGTVASSGTFAVGNNVSVVATPIGANVFLGWKTSLDATTYISNNQEYVFTVTSSSSAHYYGIFVTASSESTVGDYTYTFNNTTKTASVKKFNNTTATKTTVPQTVVENNITYTVTEIGYGAYMSNWTIDKITLPSTITKIGKSAFNDCRALQNINLPEGLIEIGGYAFYLCYSLDELNLPTSLTTIGDYAFRGMSVSHINIPKNVSVIGISILAETYSNLKTVTVDDENLYYEDRGLNAIIRKVDDALIAACPATVLDNTIKAIKNEAFYGIDMSAINIPSSVETIDYGSFNCAKITTITLNEGLKTIGDYAFANNEKITNITIPSTVTSCKADFMARSTALKTIYIDSSDIYKIFKETNFTSCFEILEKIYILSSIDDGSNTYLNNTTNYPYQYTNVLVDGIVYNLYSKVEHTDIEYLLTVESNDLTLGTAVYSGTAKIGSDITLAATPIGTNVFLGWKANLPDTSYLSTAKEYSFTFAINSSKTYYAIFAPATSEVTVGDYTYTLNNATKTAIVKIYNNSTATTTSVPSTVDGDYGTYTVDTIGKGSFASKQKLTSVVLPNTIKSIGGGTGSSSDGAFNNCHSLVSINFPDGLVSIGGYAFFYCQALESIMIPAGVTSIGYSAFSDCPGLKEIVVAEGNAKYDSRSNCNAIIYTSTNELIVGCQNTIIPGSVRTIARYSFDGCSGLTSINIPESVKNIDYGAFADAGLISVYIPASVTYIDDNYNPFTGCKDLETIVVAEGNSIYDSRNNCNAIIKTSTNTLISGCKGTVIPEDVVTIWQGSFQAHRYLEEITIPASVKSIESSAFYMAYRNLKTVYVESSTIAKALSDSTSCGRLIYDATKIYVKPEIDGNLNSYVKTNYTYQYKNVSVNGVAYNLYSQVENTDVEYYISVESNDITLGTASYSGTSKVGSSLTLAATPIGTNIFLGWKTSLSDTAYLSTNQEYTFTFAVSSSKTYYAIYLPATSEIVSSDFTYTLDNIEKVATVKSFNNSAATAAVVPQTVADNGIVYTVNTIGVNAFYNNGGNLASISLPNTIIRLDDLAFYKAGRATGIEIVLPDSLLTIGQIVFGESTIKSMTIPKNVSYIGSDKNPTASPYLFDSCSLLTKIKVSAENETYEDRGLNAIVNKSNNEIIAACVSTVIDNSIEIIGAGSFYGLNITNVVIPASVKEIEHQAFSGCAFLESITFVDGQLNQINNLCFEHTKLTSIVIPASVQVLKPGFMCWADKLTSIYINSPAVYPIFDDVNFDYQYLSTSYIDKPCFDTLKNIYILSSIDDGSNTYLSDTTNYPYQYKNITVDGEIYNLYSKIEHADLA